MPAAIALVNAVVIEVNVVWVEVGAPGEKVVVGMNAGASADSVISGLLLKASSIISFILASLACVFSQYVRA